MTLQEQIRAKRQKVGEALKAAQDISAKMRENPADGTLEEGFQKAVKDHAEELKQLRLLEQSEKLETEAAAWNTAEAGFAHRGQPGDAAAHALNSRELFSKWVKRDLPKDLPLDTPAAQFARDLTLAFIRKGHGEIGPMLRDAGFGPTEIHALMGTQGDLGGFLVPPEFRAEVVRDLAGFAVIRGMARVVPTGSSLLVLPSIQSASTQANIYATGYTGAWKPEGYVSGGTAPPTQDQPKFGQEAIPVHVWQPDAIELTAQLLEDSGAPLDSILAEIIAETRGLDEDAAFINGDGIGKPMGLTNAGLTVIKSGVSASPTYGGLIDLYTGLPAQYRRNASWLFNSLTLGKILKLTDNYGRPIFAPNELPGQLWTRPYSISEFMADPAATSKSIIFGDFRYYVIADRQELRIQRLVERYAPNVGILPTARLGGQVLRKAAFRLQTFAA